MANRLTDVIKSVWNGRTPTPVADLVALLQTVAWNFAAGLNVTGAVGITGNETVTGNLHVTGTSALDGAVTINGGTALSQYAEGTFTPTIIGSTTAGVGTYTSQVGSYSRIGNRVFFNLIVSWSAHTGTGNMTVGNLPFASNAAANNYAAATLVVNTAAIPASNEAYLPPGATAMTMITAGGAAAQAMTATGNILVSGSYRI